MKKGKAMILAVALITVFGGMNLQAGRMAGAQIQQVMMMKNFIEILKNYMEVSKNWVAMMKDDDMVIFFAADATAEIYKQKGQPLDAIPALRALAANSAKNPAAKKAILFKIKDIYKDAKKYDKALEILKEIVK